MANRTFVDKNYTLIKRKVELYATVSVGGSGAVTLEKWNYPTFGGGANANTYTAASTGAAVTGAGAYPLQYTIGSEGVRSVARTAAGLWTLTLQDNYLRLVGLNFFSTLAGGTSAIVAVCENSSITNMTSAGGSIIGVALNSATVTNLDPASGELIHLQLVLTDATEP